MCGYMIFWKRKAVEADTATWKETRIVNNVSQDTLLVLFLFTVVLLDMPAPTRIDILASYANDTIVSQNVQNLSDVARLHQKFDVIYR